MAGLAATRVTVIGSREETDHVLERGDRVPHFDVHDLSGQPIRYATIWQAKRLVLIALRPERSADEDAYLTRLGTLASSLDPQTALVITRDPVQGVDAPGVVIADEWGEIFYARSASDFDGLPDAQDLVDWVRFVRFKCPECEGEAR